MKQPEQQENKAGLKGTTAQKADKHENTKHRPAEIVLFEHFNKTFTVKVWLLILVSLLSAAIFGGLKQGRKTSFFSLLPKKGRK